MTDEVSDLGDRSGVVGIEHIRIALLSCDVCGKTRKTDDYEKAEAFIERHNKKCGGN